MDQSSVIAKIKDESIYSPRYIFMTCMSAGIAILGLLLSSPAVVIGAMLLSPLMGPILGVGFALSIGDSDWMKRAGATLAIGTIVSILFCAFIVFISPLQTVTSEIAARTRPNLLDFGVALFSAAAGAYAMIKGREGTIVGVAIATALMPPLAVVGFGLATLNWTVFWGALLLFITNFATIALTAAVMARIYDFRSSLSPRQTRAQTIGIIISFFIFALPLGLTLQQVAWEASATREAQKLIRAEFGEDARLSQMEVEFDSEQVLIRGTVFTSSLDVEAEQRALNALQEYLDRPVALDLDQFHVGTESSAAEAAQLAAANNQKRAQDQAALDQKLSQLSLISNIAANQIIIDEQKKLLLAQAKPISGAGIEVYFVMENRINQTKSDWTAHILPPLSALPNYNLPNIEQAQLPAAQQGATQQGTAQQLKQSQAVPALWIWAAKRLNMPLIISGREADLARVRAALNDAAIAYETRPTSSAQAGIISASWKIAAAP
ncbi:hypothetical protein LPB140_04515 [Sphingorhabdus lutea]|uniref:DUF389 domain-containing protein n=1 Tax=Sphingorhabdus lutea TaxID=1913578 RepID=A0A1L3JEK5_9SPHN|nr:hypothetical protein LPB140_04515 [Sphingorhabdus lutea]